MKSNCLFSAGLLLPALLVSHARGAEPLVDVPLHSSVTTVQPMTGIVLWSTNPNVNSAPIQLEFSYLTYDQVVNERGTYDWKTVDSLLANVAGRGHQAIIRWRDTYVGKENGLPESIQNLPGYRGVTAKSEGKPTGFPDWSHPEARRFLLEFFTNFADRYDDDARLAFLQVGFGLWSEYHIYDGPMVLGKTFPSLDFQSKFFRHLDESFKSTPWMISVDAAGDHTPLAGNQGLKKLPFGLFDDSFNHRRHKEWNQPNWETLGLDRWKHSPTGGEFSFFQRIDQTAALDVAGPHGISFEQQAARFHVSFMIGDSQPRYQSNDRLREAGLACGYRFKITKFASSSTSSEIKISNVGIAPLYYDAYPAVNGVQSHTSLKGLLPGESRHFEVASGSSEPELTIECERLVPGQRIEFAADLR